MFVKLPGYECPANASLFSQKHGTIYGFNFSFLRFIQDKTNKTFLTTVLMTLVYFWGNCQFQIIIYSF